MPVVATKAPREKSKTEETRRITSLPIWRGRTGAARKSPLPSTRCPDSWPFAASTPRRSRSRGPHCRQPAHDHSNGRAHRDAAGPWSGYSLGELQHLLHAGSRRRRPGRQGNARLRQEGRNARRILGIHPSHPAMARRRHPQPHPRRRRRRHPAHPPRLRRREGPDDPRPHRPNPKRKTILLRLHQARRCRIIRTSTARSPRTSSASPRKPPPASIGSTNASRRARCCSRPSTSTIA